MTDTSALVESIEFRHLGDGGRVSCRFALG